MNSVTQCGKSADRAARVREAEATEAGRGAGCKASPL